MKIEATRNTDASPVEDVVRNNVKERRDKLLRIGLAYDLAHAKGEIKETEEEKKGRKRAEAVKKAKEKKTTREKLEKEKRKRYVFFLFPFFHTSSAAILVFRSGLHTVYNVPPTIKYPRESTGLGHLPSPRNFLHVQESNSLGTE